MTVLSNGGIMFVDTNSRFDTEHECDRRTDGHNYD